MHATGSRNRLTPHQLGLYPGDTLFAHLARAVCNAAVLPRKELHEAWEVARRVRRRFRGGRVVDLCCGHGLLAQVMLMIDPSSTAAVAVDTRLTAHHRVLADALAAEFPRLRGRVEFVEASLHDVELLEGDVVVSAHACGSLTDDILRRAVDAWARVAVLPCCQQLKLGGALDGWLDESLAVDVERAVWLRGRGYQVFTHTIPAEVSPKNRLLLGSPLTERSQELSD